MDKVKENKGGLMVLLALVVLTVVFFATKKPKEEVAVNDDVLEGETLGGNVSNTTIPMPPVESWETKEVSEGKLNLDIPREYYVSKPNIEGCDATSISTELNGKPVSVAFVYKVGCENVDLTTGFAKSVEKNGYVFRTNYTSPSVIAVFEKIVNSAK
ncbi:MAG: hypothetical protein QG654_15 [Patescibacteria group bacterium]|nr:hypothetical protein [Patescibacteria group bacterium]